MCGQLEPKKLWRILKIHQTGYERERMRDVIGDEGSMESVPSATNGE
jgi:hypothetical protein